jgi:hypothetical protein
VRASTRPLSATPLWVILLLLAGLAGQVSWQAWRAAPPVETTDLPFAPSPLVLRAASFGEPELAARVAMLYLQAYDLRVGNAVPYQRLDYARLIQWLRAIVAVDPRSSYALFSAARIYVENTHTAKVRAVLEFLHETFEHDPERRWPWLAHAALVAKHRLGDLALALRYARAIDRKVRDPRAPLWAKQMEIFVLEDMNELEAAKVMLGGLIASGRAIHASDMRLLQMRLEGLERKLARSNRPTLPPSFSARGPI